MRFLSPLVFVALAVFLVGIVPAEAKKPPKPPDPLEQRVTDLEVNDAVQDSQLSDHETRIGEAETKNDTQDIRLDTLESQPPIVGAIQVFDSSVPPEFVGILVNTVPQEISSSPQDLLVQPHITVFVPSLGKFLEMYWSGEHLTYRTQIPALYFDGPNCTGNAYTDRAGNSYVLLDNEYYLYEFKDENQAHSFYTIGRYTDPDPPVIQSMKWRVKDCENYVEDLSAYYPLTMVNTNLSFPFQQPLTFE